MDGPLNHTANYGAEFIGLYPGAGDGGGRKPMATGNVSVRIRSPHKYTCLCHLF